MKKGDILSVDTLINGSEPVSVFITSIIPVIERSSVQQEQEDALVKALHETFGLPLTERVEAEKEAEAHKKAQLLTTLQQSML